MSPEPADLHDDELPLPFGVVAQTGERLPGVSEEDLKRIDKDKSVVRQRGERGAEAFLAIADVDPNDLRQAGWSVLFAANVDPAIKQALQPLLAQREKQAGRLFKVFEGTSSPRPNEDARAWVERQGAALAIVDPEQGIPVYVLIVGSPAEIPFEFQYLLDTYWSVGRLHFDTAAEYGAYAERVVAYEEAAVLPHKKRAAIFSAKNDGDRATGLLHKQVTSPLVNGVATTKPLGQKQGFQLQALLAEDATKERLSNLLRGKELGGPPALLFTGSHGVAFNMADASQREKQGALLCQDWPGFGGVAPEQMFSADDVPADANMLGMIHFLFACYGGGCPQFDNFGSKPGEETKQLMAGPIVARLPQRLLTSGALACLAHVDRAWAYSFQNSRSAPQVQEFRDVMVRVLQGQRLGQALDTFNLRWAVLSAELQEQQNLRDAFDGQVSNAALANRWVARNDARNYVVLGDPAVRLRVEAMAND